MSYPSMSVWVLPLEANGQECDHCLSAAVVILRSEDDSMQIAPLCGPCLSEVLRARQDRAAARVEAFRVAERERKFMAANEAAHAQTQRGEGAR
jgi:hypothetical protein